MSNLIAENIPMINISGLCFGLKNGLIFENFYFEATAGVFAIEGYSGCRKTTLLKLICGFLTPQVSKKFFVQGKCLMVVQEDALFPWLSGRENVQCFLGDDARVSTLRSDLTIKSYWERRACEMSYGQRRLVEISRAVESSASILLLDEPFNFLDKDNARMVWDCFLGEGDKGTPS